MVSQPLLVMSRRRVGSATIYYDGFVSGFPLKAGMTRMVFEEVE